MKLSTKGQRYLILIVCTALLIALALNNIGKKATLSYLLMASFIVVLDLRVQHKKIGNSLLAINSLFYFMCTGFEIGHSLLFNDRITSSLFFIIFETNMGESIEFVQSTFSLKGGLLLLAMVVLLVYGIIQIFTSKSPQLQIGKYHLSSTTTSALLLGIGIVLYLARSSFFPYLFYQALEEYRTEKEALSTMTRQKDGGDFEAVTHESVSERETYIVVVGESTTRRCMGLYDYYRPTTPRLSALKEELVSYRDVISPHAHTIAALDKVLTLSSFKDSTMTHQGSVLQLFNKAGFTTYWLSNQKPIGLFESSVTALSQSADHRVFVNMASNQLDETLFVPLENALADSCSKKLIVLHLMGTHLAYSRRYTTDFKIFTDQPKTQFKHKKAKDIINHYDNAVRYNDYIVHSFIEKLRAQKGRKFLLYFSDHGEEVYHDKDFAIHAEYDETKDMYDVPFIVWAPEDIRSDSSYSFVPQRKFSNEDFIYSIADLAKISFEPNDSTRSLFNPAFTFSKRMITDAKDYDKIYP